jgi:hypothetical protein
MGVIQAPAVLPGQVGVIGAMKYMVTSDNLSKITTAGYLNNLDLAVNPIFASDVLAVNYSYNQQTNSGTFGIFTVTISNGVITLVDWANAGNVLLPVVSGDVASFNGTTGQIKDSGVTFSNSSDTVSSLFHGTATAGDFVTVNNANKTIQDSGAAPSAASQPFVVMSPGTLTTGHLIKLNDANGTIADQGVAMKSVAQAAVAGGAAAQTVTDAFCTSAASVIASWNDTTNAVSIQKVAAGNGSFVVTSSADPGASHINYVIFK